jgi:hypothetical protein
MPSLNGRALSRQAMMDLSLPSAIRALCGAWLLVAIAGSGCSRQPSPMDVATHPLWSKDAVARVGTTEITQEMLRQARGRRLGSGAEDTAAVLEDLIRRELRLAEIRRTGFDQEPELRRAWTNFVLARFQETEEAGIEAASAVTDDEIAAEYAARPEAYRTPERVRAALIEFVPERTTGTNVAMVSARAAQARRTISAAADVPAEFAAVARRMASANGTTQARWWTRTEAARWWPQPAVEWVFSGAGRPGSELSPVLSHGTTCHLALVHERRAGELRPLAAVREDIRHRLTMERRAAAEAALLNDLRLRHGVETHLQAMAAPAPKLPVVAARPPSLPAR